MSFKGALCAWFAFIAVSAGCNQAPDQQQPPHAAVNAAALKAGGPDCGGGCGGAAPSAAAKTAVRVPIDGSPALGPSDAAVTLVAFSDYECPFCRRAEETVQQLEQEYGSKLRVVMKHQPLPMHANALPAAKAAAAADLQGKFWELHRALFAPGAKLTDLEAVARGAGLDVGHLRAALQDPRVDERVRKDQELARAVGANGTPTFFINGRRLAGAQPIEKFRAAIDEELARAEGLVRSGVPAARVYDKLMESASSAPPADERPTPPAVAPASERVRVDTSSAPTKGDASAPVTVVVFSDFQCPFCARGAGVMKAVADKYGDKVRFAFKHQPLPFHQQARLAAAASLAAAEQGRFWAFHDALFAHQSELDRAGLEKRATEAGMDLARFRAALDAPATEAQIAADQAEATRLGVTGTPTFFINGRRLMGAQPVEAFVAAIDEELKLR
jgi:protein-disulfide isomerase